MNASSRSSSHSARTAPGLTLIELTVVILVLMFLIILLFVGATAWKRGSDRAACTMQIRQVQVAMRSYANINDLTIGTDVSPVVLKDELIGSGLFLEAAPICPASGSYTFGGNVIPSVGTLYMTCSLATSDGHVPEGYAEW